MAGFFLIFMYVNRRKIWLTQTKYFGSLFYAWNKVVLMTNFGGDGSSLSFYSIRELVYFVYMTVQYHFDLGTYFSLQDFYVSF